MSQRRWVGAGGRRVPIVLCMGCLVLACFRPPEVADPRGQGELAAALASLPGVDRLEAATLAERAFVATAELRDAYRPLASPLLGNLAYHLGLRERALCCHWTRDLLHALTPLGVSGLSLHWAVAHHGNPLREHSSVVVVPTDGGLADGIVLDAWRDAGRLHWVEVADDRYPWQLHPRDVVRERLMCAGDLP
ncbi:MAG: hypothetical protein AAF430_09620 [Myxococcota bacterium]